MLYNYLLLAIRNIRKYKLHTFINVLCLSVGLTASMLAVMFISDELSFDGFHSKADRIFRLNKVVIEPNNTTSLTAETSGLMGPTMAQEFPEVESFVRFSPWGNKVALTFDERNLLLNEREIIFVDSSWFDVFDFKLLRGNPKTALRNPRSIVLTQNVAAALFGNTDPLGKTVRGLQDLDYEVTGIIEDAPRNSHIQYQALVSWTTTVPGIGPLNFTFMNNWIAQAIATYVVLKDPSDHQKVDSKLSKFMTDHMPTRVDKYSLYLQPFNDLYLKSYNIQALRMQKTGSAQFNTFFAIIAAFVLFLACVNYVNINTSKATRRAREVAMRKTLGAKRKQLIAQFLGESLVFVLCAGLLATLLLFTAVPYFNDLTGKNLPVAAVLNPWVIGGMASILILVTIAAGLYPAFVLSSFAPAAIHGAQGHRLSGNLPRHVLIVFQFIITISMIAGTLLIYQQIKFVLSANVGFDKEHVLVVNLTSDLVPKREVLANEISRLPNVVSTSTSQTALGLGTFSTYVIPEGFNPDEIEARVFLVDGNYQKTYGLEMAMGRFFDPTLSNDSTAVIINETMMKRLDWEDPTMKTMKFAEGQPAYPVIGVLKDFHFKSFYEVIEPLVMVISPSNQRNLAVRFTGNPGNIIEALEAQWKSIETRYPFQFFFVDETFAKAYEAEEKLLQTVITFAGISIIIACLGLYGLVSFTIEQRTREFGIRKVLGASVASISFLVNRKFIFLALIGAAVAIPLVLPFFQKWLQKFALKIDIGPMAFALAVLLTLGVTMVAVSVQAIKAGLANPVDSLRHE